MSSPRGAEPYGERGSEPPSSNLVWGILTTIFCCPPFGIVSIVYSTQVSGRWAAGDVTGARESSSKARTWAIIAAVSGLVLSVLLIVAIVSGLMALPALIPETAP